MKLLLAATAVLIAVLAQPVAAQPASAPVAVEKVCKTNFRIEHKRQQYVIHANTDATAVKDGAYAMAKTEDGKSELQLLCKNGKFVASPQCKAQVVEKKMTSRTTYRYEYKGEPLNYGQRTTVHEIDGKRKLSVKCDSEGYLRP